MTKPRLSRIVFKHNIHAALKKPRWFAAKPQRKKNETPTQYRLRWQTRAVFSMLKFFEKQLHEIRKKNKK